MEALAQNLAKEGYEVTVTCGRPYVARDINKVGGVKLAHLFSLDPRKTGGWAHVLLEIGLIWWSKPEVAHVHGWRTGALSLVAARLCPETTFVWTVDGPPNLPQWAARAIGREAVKVFDVVTAPTRALQYRLARDIKVAAEYVPDGYQAYSAPPIPLKHFGLRKGQQYALTLNSTPAAVRQVAKAYQKAGARKKLVVPRAATGPLARLARQYTFLHFAGEQGGRGRQTLLEQALVVIADKETSREELLQAMECGKPVVAITPLPAEEVLGGAALLIKAEDRKNLANTLKAVLNSKQKQVVWGRKAKRRARAHFTWERILSEYKAFYHHPRVRTVVLDSAKPASSARAATVR